MGLVAGIGAGRAKQIYFQQIAFETDVLNSDKKDINFPLLGLFGEAGGLLSALKNINVKVRPFPIMRLL